MDKKRAQRTKTVRSLVTHRVSSQTPLRYFDFIQTHFFGGVVCSVRIVAIFEQLFSGRAVLAVQNESFVLL